MSQFKDITDERNRWRALQIWQILISAAHNRQVLTYGLLAKMVGYGGGGVFAAQLGHIAFYCEQQKLPPLTCLVTNEKTGHPGSGMPIHDSISRREEVFAYDWFGWVPPDPDDLHKAFEKGRKS